MSLPWLAEPLRSTLAHARGHATLVHAAPGIGAFEFALELARAWLCEDPARGADAPACGRCGSCRLVESRVHPDLFVLLPEVQRRARHWLLVDDKPEGDEARRKPSKQIRIDEVRALIDWSTKTSARGRGKVALLHPAEAINVAAGSALLKTLEEPPPGTRLVLTAAEPAALLPTVLSRCQRVRLPAPAPADATAWLQGQGVSSPGTLLAASDGRPLDALAMSAGGVDAAAWQALPQAVAAGRAQPLAALGGVPAVLDALLKLCHDALAKSLGASPRYFDAAQVPAQGSLPALLAWSRELLRVARDAEHPWNEPLLIDALVGQGSRALAPPRAPGGGRPRPAATLGR
jgi:DNA polymerase-3 subunit delta'